jgi:hypothetical protein
MSGGAQSEPQAAWYSFLGIIEPDSEAFITLNTAGLKGAGTLS